ncbi:DUF4360 domain-containing protein [Saccharothrix hoggarensis]|uniref:DUF4360 domain-containing protein n=1 Tax=Saccharothrix hoggarensis TaxID=913853 RepID=A0ABW3QZZ5_9PSEU
MVRGAGRRRARGARAADPTSGRRPAQLARRSRVFFRHCREFNERAVRKWDDTARRAHTFNGPYSDNWQATDSTDWSAIVYAPCGEQRMLNINTELRVTAGTSAGTSFMVMDSTDSNVSTTYHFSWKRC